jgi:hypothetical protein
MHGLPRFVFFCTLGQMCAIFGHVARGIPITKSMAWHFDMQIGLIFKKSIFTIPPLFCRQLILYHFYLANKKPIIDANHFGDYMPL